MELNRAARFAATKFLLFYEDVVNMVYKTGRIADTVLWRNLADVHDDKVPNSCDKEEIDFVR